MSEDARLNGGELERFLMSLLSGGAEAGGGESGGGEPAFEPGGSIPADWDPPSPQAVQRENRYGLPDHSLHQSRTYFDIGSDTEFGGAIGRNAFLRDVAKREVLRNTWNPALAKQYVGITAGNVARLHEARRLGKQPVTDDAITAHESLYGDAERSRGLAPLMRGFRDYESNEDRLGLKVDTAEIGASEGRFSGLGPAQRGVDTARALKNRVVGALQSAGLGEDIVQAAGDAIGEEIGKHGSRLAQIAAAKAQADMAREQDRDQERMMRSGDRLAGSVAGRRDGLRAGVDRDEERDRDSLEGRLERAVGSLERLQRGAETGLDAGASLNPAALKRQRARVEHDLDGAAQAYIAGGGDLGGIGGIGERVDLASGGLEAAETAAGITNQMRGGPAALARLQATQKALRDLERAGRAGARPAALRKGIGSLRDRFGAAVEGAYGAGVGSEDVLDPAWRGNRSLEDLDGILERNEGLEGLEDEIGIEQAGMVGGIKGAARDRRAAYQAARAASFGRRGVIDRAQGKLDDADDLFGIAKQRPALAGDLNDKGNRIVVGLLEELVRLGKEKERLSRSSNPADQAAGDEAGDLMDEIAGRIPGAKKALDRKAGGGFMGWLTQQARNIPGAGGVLGGLATGVGGLAGGLLGGVGAVLGGSALAYNVSAAARNEEIQAYQSGNRLGVRDGRLLDSLRNGQTIPGGYGLDDQLLQTGYGSQQIIDMLGGMGAVGVGREGQRRLAVTGTQMARQNGMELSEVAGLTSSLRVAGGRLGEDGILKNLQMFQAVVEEGVQRGVNGSELAPAMSSLVDSVSRGGSLGSGAMELLAANARAMQMSENPSLRGRGGMQSLEAAMGAMQNAEAPMLGLVNERVKAQMARTGKSFSEVMLGERSKLSELEQGQFDNLNGIYAQDQGQALSIAGSKAMPGFVRNFAEGGMSISGGSPAMMAQFLMSTFGQSRQQADDAVLNTKPGEFPALLERLAGELRAARSTPDMGKSVQSVGGNTEGEKAIFQIAQADEIRITGSRIAFDSTKEVVIEVQRAVLRAYGYGQDGVDKFQGDDRGNKPATPAPRDPAMPPTSWLPPGSVGGPGGMIVPASWAGTPGFGGDSFAGDFLSWRGNAPVRPQPGTVARPTRPAAGGFAGGWKGKAFTDPMFAGGVNSLANDLGIDANDLLGIFAAESALDPAAQFDDGKGNTATGLLQFTGTNLRARGLTPEGFKRKSGVEQLPYVKDYLAPKIQAFRARNKREPNFGDLYLMTNFPAAVNQNDDFVLYGQGATIPGFGADSAAYRNNRGIDGDRDGAVTRGEAVDWATDKARNFQTPGRTPTAVPTATSSTQTIRYEVAVEYKGPEHGREVGQGIIAAVTAKVVPTRAGVASRRA